MFISPKSLLQKFSHTKRTPKIFLKLPYHITGEWNSWALFPYLEDLVYLRGKNDKKRDIVFCKPRLSGCYTNILFLIHSSNSLGSWWVITQESLRKCVTTTDHYSRWTTARFGPSKTRKTDMERFTLTRPGLTDWHWVPEMLLATANPLIYLFYTEILVFSRLNQGWREGGENFSSCAYSVVKSKQLKDYYYETRAA